MLAPHKFVQAVILMKNWYSVYFTMAKIMDISPTLNVDTTTTPTLQHMVQIVRSPVVQKKIQIEIGIQTLWHAKFTNNSHDGSV